jgi:hypothetical protein
MDDEDVYISETPAAQKHTKWSFIVLAVDLVAQFSRDITETLETATTLVLQHRQHKIEEDKFYEIVGD